VFSVFSCERVSVLMSRCVITDYGVWCV
jgi:hypothetical protein